MSLAIGAQSKLSGLAFTQLYIIQKVLLSGTEKLSQYTVLSLFPVLTSPY